MGGRRHERGPIAGTSILTLTIPAELNIGVCESPKGPWDPMKNALGACETTW